MMCRKCNEMIEVGEACIPVQVERKTYYYHPHCHAVSTPKRDLEDDQREDEEFERIAQQARNVC